MILPSMCFWSQIECQQKYLLLLTLKLAYISLWSKFYENNGHNILLGRVATLFQKKKSKEKYASREILS